LLACLADKKKTTSEARKHPRRSACMNVKHSCETISILVYFIDGKLCIYICTLYTAEACVIISLSVRIT